RGAVATNGADDPATTGHENVSRASKIDPARIRDAFYRELKPLARPDSRLLRSRPKRGDPFIACSPPQPAFYLSKKDLHAFDVAPPPLGGAGAVVIMIDGDLTIPDGSVNIARNVQV